MPLNVVVLGLPGAGKGTQAKKLSKAFGIPHISMGDILRNNKQYETDSGKTVGEIIDAGNPVDVDTVAALLSRRLEQPDCDEGFVLDGFPRTAEQAEAMTGITEIDVLLHIEVEEENIYKRLTNRRICPDCGESYHLVFDPPETDEQCDDCGAPLKQREDDTRERIAERIRWQREGLKEVFSVYADKEFVYDIDGNRPIAEVWADVQATVQAHA